MFVSREIWFDKNFSAVCFGFGVLFFQVIVFLSYLGNLEKILIIFSTTLLSMAVERILSEVEFKLAVYNAVSWSNFLAQRKAIDDLVDQYKESEVVGVDWSSVDNYANEDIRNARDNDYFLKKPRGIYLMVSYLLNTIYFCSKFVFVPIIAFFISFIVNKYFPEIRNFLQ